MSKCKKGLLLVAVILITSVSLVFAQGNKISDTKDDTIIFKTSHEGTTTIDTGFYIPSKQINLDLLTYGTHYIWNEVKNEDGTTTAKLEFTDAGKEVIKEKLKVVEIKRRLVGNNFHETIEDYSIEDYEKQKGGNLTEILATALLQFAEKTGRDRIEETSGTRQFQSILNEIYTTIKKYLRTCYSVFALGEEKAINDNLEIQKTVETPTNELLTSNVNTSDKLTAGKNYLKWILFSLLTIELIIVAVSSFVKGVFPASEVIKKFFICVLILFFISNIWNLTELASRVFVQGGNIAGRYDGGGSSSWFELMPGDALEGYFKAAAQIDKAEDQLLNSMSSVNLLKLSFSSLKQIAIWLLFFILKLVLFIIYTITALYILLWQTELYLLIIIATFLLPFWIFRYTNFLTKGIPQTLLGQCVKLFTATLVLRICSGLFDPVFATLEKFARASGWSIGSMVYCYLPGVIIISMVVCYFTLKAPETARAILSGTPTTDGNIHGMATRMSTKAITMPIAMSSSKVKGLASTATTLYGASRAHAGGKSGEHAGRTYAFTHGGIKTGLEYMLGKQALRKMGIHNRDTTQKAKPQGMGTDPNSRNLDAEGINSLGDKKNE